MKIYLLIYTHKHGTDVTAYESSESAHKKAIEIVREYRKDFEITNDIAEDEALDNWFELSSGTENIEFDECELCK